MVHETTPFNLGDRQSSMLSVHSDTAASHVSSAFTAAPIAIQAAPSQLDSVGKGLKLCRFLTIILIPTIVAIIGINCIGLFVAGTAPYTSILVLGIILLVAPIVTFISIMIHMHLKKKDSIDLQLLHQEMVNPTGD